jgi:vacuole morphology and inheritance protein 14
MLLPQSSAFAALKNRLNSVSAIGYLHIAPRTYVTSPTALCYFQSLETGVIESISTFHFHLREKCLMETHALQYSAPATAAPSSYDRPNRLKGRDEGIRWAELLEKFRSVQEKARRAQRPGGGDLDDVLGFGSKAAEAAEAADAKAFKDLARLPGPPIPVKDSPPAPAAAQAQAQKSKTGLGKFGRLGGAVSGSRPKK